MAAGQTTKTLVLSSFGGYDKMKVEALPMPRPSSGEVLVNIKASGINFAELMVRQGSYDRLPKLPAVLVLEGAGVIVGLGPNVTDLKVSTDEECGPDEDNY
jgi:NADPH:quinone reductase-like Zn-dependent oxidoreductase